MKPAVKWGIAAASGAAVFLALRKMKKAQEQNADNTQLALQQLVESSQSSEIIETYGEWREITQTTPFAVYHMGEPTNVEGKKIIMLSLQLQGDWQWGFVATPTLTNAHYGMIVGITVPKFTGKFRIVARWI